MKHIRHEKKVVKSLKFTPTGEEKAFIYQQASELKVPVIVLMEKTTGTKNFYSVTFILDPVNLNLKVKGEGNNVFEACIQAKEMAKEQFARAIGVPLFDAEREFLIELIKNKVQMH